MSTWLVTRPEPGASALARALRARGQEALVAPVLAIELADPGPIDWTGVQAVLLTSANGARGLARADARRDVPVLAVGDGTAEAAREAGFAQVRSAGGTAEDLTALTVGAVAPRTGPVLFARGAEVAGDLAGMLQRDGFEVREAVVYRAVPVASLPERAAAALRKDALAGVILMSPRSAHTFSELVGAAGLTDRLRRLAALTPSMAVAKRLRAADWARIEVAARPGLPGILELLPRSAEAGAAVERIVSAFGGIRPMATKLGMPFTTVQGWKKRGGIPAARLAAIRAAAASHGITIGEADLAEAAHVAEPEEPPPVQPVASPAPPAAAPEPERPGNTGRTAATVAIAGAIIAITAPAWSPVLFGGAADAPLEDRIAALESAPGPDLSALQARLWDPLESTCRHASLSIL